MISSTSVFTRRSGTLFLLGTALSTVAAPLAAQVGMQQTPAVPPTGVAVNQPQVSGTIRSIAVTGAQRLEPATVISYSNLQPGMDYTAETIDAALKDLYATELFADVVITGADTGNIVIAVKENPVINRIILEGNKRIKDDKIRPEIRLAPRQIFTRSKARSDVDRIVELYKRSGRFAAAVEPKIVQLDQNRVDLVFEITEGPVSKVRAINIIGNEQFSDSRLRKEMYTRVAGGPLAFLRQNDSYDPDRLAADQQKLRAFYLTQGYADFRVVSALAELTPDRRDFVITYVVEEGERYKFGEVKSESALRDLDTSVISKAIPIKSGDWFNAKQVEDVVTNLNEIAGAQGYAFANIEPSYDRDSEKKLMNITFKVNESPRAYIERIDIAGNTVTRDKVIRREFRINEGDAFNAIKIKRSQDRLQSLGFFQDKLEIKQTQGSAPDRVVLGVDVEERSTGELQLSAGYSSLEKFIISADIAQRNFLGKGQELSAGVNWSRYSRSVHLGFTEPNLFDKNVLVGGEVFRRDYNSFNTIGSRRNTTYSQVSTGINGRLGVPLNEFLSLGGRYSLTQEKISLDEGTFFTNGECDILRAGRYLCDELGTTISSVVGYSLIYDNRNGIRATRGQRVIFSQDVAGLGGDVKYLRNRLDATKYMRLPKDFILSLHAEGGYIHPLQGDRANGADPIRLSDRFFGPQLRGFDIRGIGPRIQRHPYNEDGSLNLDANTIADAIGGRAYYMGRVELEIPVSANIRSLGLRPSAFVDVGSLFKLKRPDLTDIYALCTPNDATHPVLPNGGELARPAPGDTPPTCPTGYTKNLGFQEEFLGNSSSPRLSIGIGVNWISPFGPLRIDIAKALLKQKGDETKFFSFNVGTQF